MEGQGVAFGGLLYLPVVIAQLIARYTPRYSSSHAPYACMAHMGQRQGGANAAESPSSAIIVGLSGGVQMQGTGSRMKMLMLLFLFTNRAIIACINPPAEILVGNGRKAS